MLTKLTSELIKLDNDKLNKELFIEGAILPSKMSVIKKFTLTEDFDKVMHVDVCSIENNDLYSILASVKFDDDETEEDRKKKLYELCIEPTTMTEYGSKLIIDKTKNIPIIDINEDDYNHLKECINNLNNEDNKSAIKDIKQYLVKLADKMSTFTANFGENYTLSAYNLALVNTLFRMTKENSPNKEKFTDMMIIKLKIATILKWLTK